MEHQLFTWKSHDVGIITCFDVTLKVKIGKFEQGTFFDYARVDFDKESIQLGHFSKEPGAEGGPKPVVEFYDFKLKLSIVEDVPVA